MKNKKVELQIMQDKVQNSIEEVNKKIKKLGENSNCLYNSLKKIQEKFDLIRNMPNEIKFNYTKLKEIRSNWNDQVEKIENDYKKVEKK